MATAPSITSADGLQSYLLRELTAGQSYEVMVRAVNSVGPGPNSTLVAAVPLPREYLVEEDELCVNLLPLSLSLSLSLYLSLSFFLSLHVSLSSLLSSLFSHSSQLSACRFRCHTDCHNCCWSVLLWCVYHSHYCLADRYTRLRCTETSEENGEA